MESERFLISSSRFSKNKLVMLDPIPIALPVYDFDCEMIEILEDRDDFVKITLNLKEENIEENRSFASTLMSCSKADSVSDIVFTSSSLERLPHEILQEGLKLRSSNTMVDIGKKVDSVDNLTPDYIEVHGKRALVLEIKTHREVYWEGEKEHWFSDQWKYWTALDSKLEEGWSIILSTVFMFRNQAFVPECLLSEDWVSLSKLVQAAWSLQSYLFSHTNLTRQKVDNGPIIQTYLTKFANLAFPSKEDELHFDEREIEQISTFSPKDRENFQKIMKREIKRVIYEDDKALKTCRAIRKHFTKSSEYISEYETNYRRAVQESNELLGANEKQQKSVCQHPIVSVLYTEWSFPERDTRPIYEFNETTKIWSKFLLCHSIHENANSLDLMRLENNEEITYKERSQRFVYKITLDKTTELKLALDGVRGKKRRSDSEKILKTKSSKLGFPLETSTTDIEEFVNSFLSTSSPWWTETQAAEPVLETVVRDYEEWEKQFSVVESKLGFDDFVDRLAKSKIFRALRVLEQIVAEVNYSRQSNLKSSDEYIIKKVPLVDAYVMIVPTRSDRHVFYSVIFPKESVELAAESPMRSLNDMGPYLCSDFVSLDADRISHLLHASNKVLSLFVQKLTVSGSTDCNDIKPDEGWFRECAFTLLAYLEDKAQTSAALLNIRYAYMDLLSVREVNTHPLKILEKMPVIIRSRLLVWAINKVITSFNYMYRSKMIESVNIENELGKLGKESEASRDKLVNVISWITGFPLIHFSHMLDLSYLGHLHNKEEGDTMHGHFKIFSKVAKEELALRTCKRELLLGEREPYPHEKLGSHEFSASFVKTMAYYLKTLLNQKITEKYPDIDFGVEPMAWYLCDKLSRLDLRKLATTKASAWDLENLDKHVPKHDDSTNRRKVMSAMAELFRTGKLKGTNVIDLAFQSLEMINARKNKGCLVNLFKKQQLGGAREIFVLTFQDRLVIHILEVISRALCELLDNEMLTKGDAKIIRSDDHMRAVHTKSQTDTYHLTGVTSGDATTWCQRFTMRIFGFFLFTLLPKEFHPYIAHVLKFVTNKKLQLPSALLDMWLLRPEVLSSDPVMCEVKEQFLGPPGDKKISHDLVDYMSVWLKNRSNFMQGILHYTSSLMHAAYLKLMHSFLEQDFKDHDFDGVITTKCSSDDSSFILTLVSKEKQPLINQGKKFIRRALRMVNNMYWVFGAKSSETKTTLCVLNLVEEFNSVWLVRNTVITPLIKFILPAFRSPPYTRLDAPQQQFASARAQILSSGGTFLLLKVIQKQQALAHYKNMGIFNHSEGQEIYRRIKSTLSPFLGFFIQEPAALVGTLGYDFAYYFHLCQNPLALENHTKLLQKKHIDLNESLEFQSMITIGPGGLRRYTHLCKQMMVDRKELEEFFEKHPEKLIQKWSDSETATRGLQLKGSKYETAEIFAGIKDSVTHARSVYLLSSKIFNERVWYETAHTQKNTYLYLLKKFQIKKPSTDKVREVLDNSWKNLFGLHEFYDVIIRILLDELKRKPTFCEQKRRLMVTRSLRTYEGPHLTSLRDCVSYIWFGLPVSDMRNMENLKTSWKAYKTAITWLDDTLEKTLELSPFENKLKLIDFVSSFSAKVKSIICLVPMRLNISTETFVRKLIRWNQWPNNAMKETTQPHQPSYFDISGDLTGLDVLGAVANIASFPKLMVTETKSGIVDELPRLLLKQLSVNEEVIKLYDKMKLMNREVEECLKCLSFYHAVNSELTPRKRHEKLCDCLNETGTQFMRYRVKQSWNGTEWTGPIAYDLIINGEKFHIRGRDGILTKLICSSVSSVLKVTSKLCCNLLESGFKTTNRHNNKADVYINLFSGKHQKETEENSLPLIINPDVGSKVVLPRDPSLKFEVREHSIKLVECNTETTVSICRITKMGYFHSSNEGLIKDCFKNLKVSDSVEELLILFAQNTKLEAGDAQRLLKRLLKLNCSSSQITKKWLQNILKSRLKEKGYTCINPTTALMDVMVENSETPARQVPELDLFKMSSKAGVDFDIDEFCSLLAEYQESEDENDDSRSVNSEASSVDSENIELIEAAKLRQKFLTNEPDLIGSKSWMDEVLKPVTSLTRGDVIKLLKGELTASEATGDLVLLAKFMGWSIKQSKRFKLNF